MTNFVPNVTQTDVVRIIERDFGIDQVNRVYGLLTENSSPLWARGIDNSREPPYDKMFDEHRVFLSILKLANGDIGEIENQIKVANVDPRDVIGFAEYPRFMRLGFVGVKKLDTGACEKLQREDWDDYLAWLNNKSAPTP